MKTIIPTSTFTAYPNKKPEVFEEGGTFSVPAELANAWEADGRVKFPPASRKTDKDTGADAS